MKPDKSNAARIPDGHAYSRYTSGQDVFQPWQIDRGIATLMRDLINRGSITLVDWDRMWTLKWAFAQTAKLNDEIWELGVYRGGSALFLKRLIEQSGAPSKLRLFDSFEGLPTPTSNIDLHNRGDFADTSLDEVKALLGTESFIDYRKGWIPNTFDGLEGSEIRFAHIDLDLYQPMLDACTFVYPRLKPGGVLVLDDYGLDTCPGVRKAVDTFFADCYDIPLCLPTGQAILVKHCS